MKMATRNRFVMIAFAMLAPFMLSLLVDSAEAYSLGPRSECDWICTGLDFFFANKDELVTVSGSAFGENYNVDIVAPIYSEEERAIFAIVVLVIVTVTIIILVILCLCFCCMCCGGNRRRSQPQIYMHPANVNPAAAAVAPPPPNNFGPAGFGAPLYPEINTSLGRQEVRKPVLAFGTEEMNDEGRLRF